MQIKTKMKYNLINVSMASIKKTRQQVLVRMWRRGKTSVLMGMQNGAATMENSK